MGRTTDRTRPAGRGVSARAWCRVDLAGGTLDIWPLGLLHAGPTVNLAVDIAARVELHERETGWRVVQGGSRREARRPEELLEDPTTALVGQVVCALGLPAVEVRLRSDSPRGGGLGASSALAVGLLAAGRRFLDLPPQTPEAIAALARDLEARLMQLPTGTQDHYPALLGGALAIEHRAGGEGVRPLDVDLERLAHSLVVVYSGVSHFSAANNWQVVRRRLEGDADVRARFDAIAQVALAMVASLEAGEVEESGRLLSAEWEARRGLAPEVSNEAVERLLAAGLGAGAWGGKACGAGGGGCLVFLAPPERRLAVEAALVASGGRLLPCRPASTPLEVEAT